MAKIKATMKIGLTAEGVAVPFEHESAVSLLVSAGKPITDEIREKYGIRKDGTVPSPDPPQRPKIAEASGRPTISTPRPPAPDEKPIPVVTKGMKKPRLLQIAKRRGLDNLEGRSGEDLFAILSKYDDPDADSEGPDDEDPDEFEVTLETELTTELTRAQLEKIAELVGFPDAPPADVSDAQVLAILQAKAAELAAGGNDAGEAAGQDEGAGKGQGADGVEGEAPESAGE